MQRIVDINAQFYAARETALEDYRRLLAAPEVVAVVATGMDLRLTASADWPFMSCFCTSNQQMLEFVARLKSPKLVPFAFVDPTAPGAAAQVERLIRRDGFRGIKMYPPHGWRPDEERVRDAFLAVQECDVPVFLHMGRTASHPQLRSEFARPLHLEGLGLACPRLKVIIGHFGAPWSLEACHIAMGFPNFYFDLSTSGAWQSREIAFVAKSPYLGAGRLLLGTNHDGSTNLDCARKTIERLTACSLTADEVDRVACRNACELLGLETPSPRTT